MALVVPGLVVEAGVDIFTFLAANVVAVHYCWYQFWGRRWGFARLGYLFVALSLCFAPYAADWWINRY